MIVHVKKLLKIAHECTHWAIYQSLNIRQCLDCGKKETLESVQIFYPKHQR